MAGRFVPAADMSTDYLKKPYKLLRPGADASVTDKDGNGAFHYLVQSDMFKSPASSPDYDLFGRRVRPPSPVDDPSMTMEELIHSLQAAGADINLQNKSGKTPLHVLCGHASWNKALDETFCEFLCQAGADLNIRDHQGRSPVFSLFLNGRLVNWRRDEGEHLCQLVSRLGGRFDIRDSHGRTVIHCLFSSEGHSHLSLVEPLTRHGVDPSAVDDEGNTLWHAAINRLDSLSLPQADKQIMDLLLRLGVDPQKPNKLGRNPLHELSSREAPRLEGHLSVFPACIPDLRTTAFDNLLQLYLERGYGLDFRDNQGITPLHLACTFSEYQAARLLDAGADPKIPTHEELTPFHIAARCGQANIIGLLLEQLKEHGSGQDSQVSSFIHEVINAEDAYGRSPLYYACICGRAESVALLLDAGASVQSDEYSGSVWQACAEFEEERLNWSSSPPPTGRPVTASSVLIEGKTRPKPRRANKFPREHLGDVLRLLLHHQDAPGATTGYLDEAIKAAAAKQHDYTVWCLMGARNSLEPGTATVPVDEPTSACLARVNAIDITEAASLAPQDLRAEFQRLMGLRRHDLVQSLLLEHGWGELDWDGNTFIHDLVRKGFVSLLRGLALMVKDLSAKLQDVEWCDAQKLASSNGSFINRFPESWEQNFAQGSIQPLLLVACRTEEPNMEMVRFLVEEISCDVDFQGYVRVHFPDLPTGFGICKHETPTHGLVRGRTTWWHVSQALPYLAEKRGSNLELRDCFGSTPLDVAISHIGRVTFNRGAVDKLLSLGADAKAVDLSRTCESAEMTDLLLSRGAVVKPAAILAAVRTRNLDVLSMLLSRGGDVNARETATPATPHHQNALIYVESTAPPREKYPVLSSEMPKHLRGDPRLRQPAPKPHTGVKDTPFSVRAPPYVPEHEMYPLDYAAHLFSRQPELDGYSAAVLWATGEGPVVRNPPRPLPEGELASVIEMLIAHGADVMATYELADGSRMSIKDRIVLRGRSFIGLHIRLDRPRLARRILELCKTTYDGDF